MHDTDVMLVVGIICVVLAGLSLLAAYFDGRVPKVAAFVALIGGVLLALAVTRNPEGYRIEEIPHVFFRVIAQILP